MNRSCMMFIIRHKLFIIYNYMFIISVISIYLVYVTCFYQTTNNFSLSFQNFGQSIIPGLYHSTSNELSNKICPLGKLATLILVAMLWVLDLDDLLIFYYTLGLFFAGIAMNLNFAIYILPVLIILVYNMRHSVPYLSN